MPDLQGKYEEAKHGVPLVGLEGETETKQGILLARPAGVLEEARQWGHTQPSPG